MIKKFATSILTSVLTSAVIFVALYSFMTGEFPPKISSLKTNYEGIKQTASLSRQMQDQAKELEEALKQERIEKLRQGFAVRKEVLHGEEDENGNLRDIASENPSAPSGDAKIKALEYELYRLQGRVNQLEEQLRNLPSHR